MDEQSGSSVQLQHEAEQCRRLALIVERTTNMVVVTDHEHRIRWVNPAYTRITGWTLAEVLGRTPRSFLHGPKTSLTELSRIGSMLRRGQPVHDAELLNYTKSGETYWVSLRIDPILDDGGKVVEYVSIQTDITERKRRELESARLLRLLREAQRLAHLGSMEHDVQSGQVQCSDEIFRILDVAEGEVDTSYESLMACTHPDDLAHVRGDYEQALRGGWPFESEHRVVSKSGQVKWVHMRGMLDALEESPHAVCRLSVQDITQRKQAEQLLRDKAASDQVARTQRETLARVGHEIRTPLHAIQGFADLFERNEGLRLTVDARRQLGHIRTAARHLLTIANDMMDLGAMHEGRIALTIQSVPVAEVAAEAAGMLQSIAAAKGLSLDVQAPPGPLSARADRQRLMQVLVNLIGNAIKYNRPGGNVRVICEEDGTLVKVSVVDTGIGIPATDLQRLFEPFFRGSAATVPPPEGSNGLGLAITRSLAEAMDGHIAVRSEPGNGSVFTLILKRAATTVPATATPPAPLPARDAGQRPRTRLLYIEDNEVNRMLVEGFVAKRPDLALVSCADGATGLDAARRLQPDIVLIDIDLPDMTGHDVLRAILAEPQLRRACCVAFSADGRTTDIETAIRSGFMDYLQKPLSAEGFLAAIDQLIAANQDAQKGWMP